MQEPFPRTLVCAATQGELDAFGGAAEGIALALTGVGIPCVFAQLPNALQDRPPERILNIGIAGAYPNSGLAIGDVVLGTAETYGDVGFELPEEPGFQSVREVAFGRAFYSEPLPLAIFPEFAPASRPIPQGVGCTVNLCTGTERTGLVRERLFNAQFETMEGAAVAQIGRHAGIPVCEIRAISNIASTREMRPENIRLALANLASFLNFCRKESG